MDKETLSSYGWIIVVVLILAVMFLVAPLFGNTIKGAVKDVINSFSDKGNSAMSDDDLLNKGTFGSTTNQNEGKPIVIGELAESHDVNVIVSVNSEVASKNLMNGYFLLINAPQASDAIECVYNGPGTQNMQDLYNNFTLLNEKIRNKMTVATATNNVQALSDKYDQGNTLTAIRKNALLNGYSSFIDTLKNKINLYGYNSIGSFINGYESEGLTFKEYQTVLVNAAEEFSAECARNGITVKCYVTEDSIGFIEIQPTCCFDAGSQVLMANGSTKNIEDVKAGDKVMSLNEATGKYVAQEVKAPIIKHNSDDLVYVYLSDGSRIGMRAYHPLLTTKGWRSLRPEMAETCTDVGLVDKLQVGDTLVGINGNKTITKIVQRPAIENYDTYNLTMPIHHNYIVDGVVVHNAGCKE